MRQPRESEVGTEFLMPSNIYLPLAKTPIVALVVESREATRRRGGAQAVLHASAVPSARWNPCIDSTSWRLLARDIVEQEP